MRNLNRNPKIAVLGLLSLGVSTLALAELIGPLGNIMHGLMTDLNCIENPGQAFFCDDLSPTQAVADMILQAQKLHDQPELVANLIPGAETAAVVTTSQELLTHLGELQSAISAGDAAKTATALAAVQQTEKDAHHRFKPAAVGSAL